MTEVAVTSKKALASASVKSPYKLLLAVLLTRSPTHLTGSLILLLLCAIYAQSCLPIEAGD